jgi:hypothetical protein
MFYILSAVSSIAHRDDDDAHQGAARPQEKWEPASSENATSARSRAPFNFRGN